MTDAAAISGTLKGLKTLADSTVRLTIDVDERHMQDCFNMYEQNMPVAIARLQAAQQQPEYGQWAKKLRLSGFFRAPDVWKALGTDAEYQDWCREQKCAVCGYQDWDHGQGIGRCEYAHVRRAGESGTGYKAEYAGIPLCHKCHKIQHDKGEFACLEARSIFSESVLARSGEWFDEQRIKHVENWAWYRLKTTLGHESMKTVPPEQVKQWADERELTQYLPSEFREL